MILRPTERQFAGKQYSELVAIERGAVKTEPSEENPEPAEVSQPKRPSLGELDRAGLMR